MVMVGHNPDDRRNFDVGMIPTLMVCNRVPNVPPLRKGSVVRIWADAFFTYGLIGFDVRGDLNSPTSPSDYPFPHRRPFSVVYKVGPDDVPFEGAFDVAGVTGHFLGRAEERGFQVKDLH